MIYGSEGEEKERLERMIVILNLNLAACALKSKLFDIAIINCDKVYILLLKIIKMVINILIINN